MAARVILAVLLALQLAGCSTTWQPHAADTATTLVGTQALGMAEANPVGLAALPAKAAVELAARHAAPAGCYALVMGARTGSTVGATLGALAIFPPVALLVVSLATGLHQGAVETCYGRVRVIRLAVPAGTTPRAVVAMPGALDVIVPGSLVYRDDWGRLVVQTGRQADLAGWIQAQKLDWQVIEDVEAQEYAAHVGQYWEGQAQRREAQRGKGWGS